jgi:hypothetical protein
LSTTWPATLPLHPFVGQCRVVDVAALLLLRLDIVFETTHAYLDVLRAKTNERIRNDIETSATLK